MFSVWLYSLVVLFISLSSDRLWLMMMSVFF